MTKIEEILTSTKQEFETLIKQHKLCAVVRPTGLGKTQLFAEYARGKKSLFVVPRNALKQDIRTRFYWLTKEDCTIVTYSMLSKLFTDGKNLGDCFGDLDFICLDEMHRAEAPMWSEAIKELFDVYADTEKAGGSATPIRCDGINVVETIFDNIQVSRYTMLMALRDGVFTTTYVTALYDFQEDFNNIDLSKLVNVISKDELKTEIKSRQLEYSKTLNASSILRKHLSSIDSHMKFIVFFSDIDTLKVKAFEVEQWFKDAFPNKRISSYIMHHKAKDSQQALKEFTIDEHSVDIKLLMSVDMVSEGVHVPNTTGVVLLRKTSSPVVFSQQIGRGISADNPNSIVFDFVNNINNTYRVQENLGISNNAIVPHSTDKATSESQDFYSAVTIFDYTLEVEEFKNRIMELSVVTDLGMTVKDQNKVIDLYLSGTESIKEISKQTGITQRLVERCLRLASVYEG